MAAGPPRGTPAWGCFWTGKAGDGEGIAALVWGWGWAGSGGGRAECEFKNKRRGDKFVRAVAVLEAGLARGAVPAALTARPPPRCSACLMVVSHLVSPVKRSHLPPGQLRPSHASQDKCVCYSTSLSKLGGLSRCEP